MKITYPYTGWVRVASKERLFTPRVFDEIPGFKRLDELCVELPHTMWDLPIVDAWLRDTEIMVDRSREVSCGAGLHKGYEGLYGYQKRGVDWCLQHAGTLLGDSPGLGKSAQSIVASECYAGNETRPRIILGPKFVRASWKRELFRTGAISDEREFQALEGRNADAALGKDVKWFFLHYEIAAAWWSRLIFRRPITAIIDEVHICKGVKSQRTKAAAMIAGACPFRVLLTGTPILNRTSEMWPLLDMAGGTRTFGTFWDFKTRYCGMTHNGHGYQEGAPTHVEELSTRLKSVYLRRTVEEVGLDIPALTRTIEEATLEDRTRQECDDLLEAHHTSYEEIYDALQSGGVGDSTLATIMELRKVTSAAKLAHTTEYLVSLCEQGESAVVFTWERNTAELLAQRVGHQAKVPCYVVHGGYSQTDRDRAVDAFQGAGGVIFATIDSLGVGVTLTRARTVILHDLDWTPAKLLQAEGRVRRIGQNRPCQSVWMVAGRSIDVLFARMLFRKGGAIAQTTHDRGALDAASNLQYLTESSLEADIERLIKF